ncbi:MAG: MarR family winged helix-turn-helix transcriptional regulator [Actinomycetota bacterium]|jgi:DNA-binding MarR family transcriptional regulator|nr:MarR family winged helix-turn-helix transcriptional regulator [Actinomycetota bacterium]MDA8343276.1 MarR family winged helix-turn-helix transcriptional regulator [Actinomycetota bacterium]
MSRVLVGRRPDPPSVPEPAAIVTGDPVVGIARSLAMLSRTLDDSCVAAGLTLAQYRALLFVALRPWRAAALAGEMGVRRPTLSGIIDSLDRAGLVERRSVEDDRRGVSISLTPTGSAVLRSVEVDMRARLERAMARSRAGDAIDPAELAGMLRTLLRGMDRPGSAEAPTGLGAEQRERRRGRRTGHEPEAGSGARRAADVPEGATP